MHVFPEAKTIGIVSEGETFLLSLLREKWFGSIKNCQIRIHILNLINLNQPEVCGITVDVANAVFVVAVAGAIRDAVVAIVHADIAVGSSDVVVVVVVDIGNFVLHVWRYISKPCQFTHFQQQIKYI